MLANGGASDPKKEFKPACFQDSFILNAVGSRATIAASTWLTMLVNAACIGTYLKLSPQKFAAGTLHPDSPGWYNLLGPSKSFCRIPFIFLSEVKNASFILTWLLVNPTVVPLAGCLTIPPIVPTVLQLFNVDIDNPPIKGLVYDLFTTEFEPAIWPHKLLQDKDNTWLCSITSVFIISPPTSTALGTISTDLSLDIGCFLATAILIANSSVSTPPTTFLPHPIEVALGYSALSSAILFLISFVYKPVIINY